MNEYSCDPQSAAHSVRKNEENEAGSSIIRRSGRYHFSNTWPLYAILLHTTHSSLLLFQALYLSTTVIILLRMTTSLYISSHFCRRQVFFFVNIKIFFVLAFVKTLFFQSSVHDMHGFASDKFDHSPRVPFISPAKW
jgi:hypothetical protein